MSAKKIPVSYEFFKKYTFHEEWVETMLKAKAKGNQQKYQNLLQSEEAKENALRSYYEAFYLKPQIRKKHHIRLKAVPKKIKDKLLAIPVQDTGEANNVGLTVQLEKAGVSNANTAEPKRLILMGMKDVCDADDEVVVVDDSEPFDSPEVNSTPRQINDKISSPVKIPAKEVQVNSSSKAFDSPEVNSTPRQINDKISSPVKIPAKEVQVNSSSKVVTSPANNNATTSKQSIGNISASSEMQTAASANPQLMETDNNKHETNNKGKTKAPRVNFQELLAYVHCCPITLKEFRSYTNINQLAQEFCQKKQLGVKQHAYIVQRSYILFYLVPEQRTSKMLSNIKLLDNCPAHIKSKFFEIPTNIYKKQDLNKTEENNNENQQIAIPEATQQNISTSSPGQSTDPIIKLPVSLDLFKKYTHFEEIVQELFKLKAQNNNELYVKYKNSQEAFDTTVFNYYRTFYLKPMIRETFPIRFKPLPNFIKSKLLEIPEGVNATSDCSFRLEELVSVEFNVPVEVENEAITNNGEEVSNAINNSNISAASPTNTTSATKITEKDTESLEADNKTKSPTGSSKIANTEDLKSPLPKRQKIQQTQDNTENIKTKKYKELLSYAHCCPITLLEFCKYTNVSELFTSYCQERYNSLKKLPYLLKRAYVFYYLAPENRAFKPFSELEALDECPLYIKEKIHQIPHNLYLKEDNTNEMLIEEQIKAEETQTENVPGNTNEIHIEEQMETEEVQTENVAENTNGIQTEGQIQAKEAQTENVTENSNEKQIEDQLETEEAQAENLKENCTQNQAKSKNATNPNYNRKGIEILENRLLNPTHLGFSTQSSNAASNCFNNNCPFYHITQMDIIQQPNILDIISSAPQDISVIKNYFKKYIYELFKNPQSDQIYSVKGALWGKLLKYNQICEKCESEIQALLKQDSTQTCNEPAKESNSSSAADSETEVQSSDDNNERMETNLEEVSMEVDEFQTVDRSSNSNLTERSSQGSQCQQPSAEKPRTSQDLWKNLKSEKAFQLFSAKLLAKLQQTFDNVLYFSSECYEIFLQSNEIPLKALLNEFCANNEDIVERILNEKELYEALQRYYYYKYLTNKNFAAKYPVKIKQTTLVEKENVTNEMEVEKEVETEKDNSNKTLLETNREKTSQHISKADKTISPKASEKQKDYVYNDVTKTVEKAKRIFFRQVDKTNTLFYILRTSFGLKQLILRSILTLTFQEFHQLTSIYEGKELYKDNHLAECMYRYVFKTPMVWPTNLFMTLKDLCEFLHKKNIRFNDYATMLNHISPKLLHWSVLLSCTNILECVKIDYEKRTGKILDTYEVGLKAKCIEYYNRCWKHDKWLGAVPLVYEAFYNDLLNNNAEGNVTTLDESALVEVSKESNDVSYNAVIEVIDNAEPSAVASNLNKSVTEEQVSDSVPQIDVECPTVTKTSPDRSIKEFNCVMLPSTQQQIEMLPSEARVSNDPLNNSNNLQISNVSANNSEEDEIECLGELVTNVVKTEPNNSKLLTNLLFYEDENNCMQCEPCSEEIINLDDTRTQNCDQEHLSPFHIELEDVAEEVVLSDDLASIDNSNSIMNLAQRLPSSLESNNDSAGFQQQFAPAEQGAPAIQMVNVSLRSSGENANHENLQETQLEGIDFENMDEKNGFTLNSHELELLQTSVQSCVVYADAQRFPSTFEELSSYSGAAATPTRQNLNSVQMENVNSSLASYEVQPSNTLDDNNQHSTQINTVLSKFRGFGNKNESKSVATVRPLKNSHFVPQIQHNTRPLLTKPAHTARTSSSSKSTPGTTTANSTPVAEQHPSTSLTRIEENSATNEQSVQNSCLLSQQQSVGTHIHISQEFQTNCSVFNNSSLLRLVDHNYEQRSQTSAASLPSTQTQSDKVAGNTHDNGNQQKEASTEEAAAVNQQQQPARRVTRRSSMLNSQPIVTSSSPPNIAMPTAQINLPASLQEKKFCVPKREH